LWTIIGRWAGTSLVHGLVGSIGRAFGHDVYNSSKHKLCRRKRRRKSQKELDHLQTIQYHIIVSASTPIDHIGQILGYQPGDISASPSQQTIDSHPTNNILQDKLQRMLP